MSLNMKLYSPDGGNIGKCITRGQYWFYLVSGIHLEINVEVSV